ncbi:MAG: PAS domain S-box protein [Balneolaceae bacterium]|nr:MAG: PAS domain S-box protein [Balneolaceae bacterium]
MGSSDLYNSVFKRLPVPALILSVEEPAFTIQDVNESFSDIVESDHVRLIGKPFFDVFPFKPTDLKHSHGKKMLLSFRKVLQSGAEDCMGIQHYEYISRTTGQANSQFYEITNIPLKDDSGIVINIIHCVKNLTELVLQKRRLERSENRFKNLVENSGDAIFIYDRDINLSYASPAVQHILGYSEDEIFELNLLEAVHPEDLSGINYSLKMSLENPGMPIFVEPIRFEHKDGTYRWLESTITNLLNNPSINGIVDNFRDVTDRIEATNEVQQTKDRLEEIIQTVDGILWEANADDFVFTYVSPQSREILGYTPEEWIGVEGFWSSKIHPDDRNFAVNYCHSETLKEKNHALEYRMKKADGNYIWMRYLVTVVKENDKPVSLRGLMLDITPRKELELQLEQAYEIAKIGNWSYSVEDDELVWSEFVKEIFEVEPDYKPGTEPVLDFCFNDSYRKQLEEAVNEAVENNHPYDVEIKIKTAKGTEKWVRTMGIPEFKDGILIKVFGNTQDITKRKMAQLNLIETEQKLRDIVEHSTNLFYSHDTEGILSYLSPQSVEFLGYKPEEAMRRWTDFITDHPKNEIGFQNTQKAIETGKAQPPYEIQLKRKDGSIIWAAVNEAPFLKDGRVVGMVGSLTDVTERKIFEERLIDANKKLTATQKIAKLGSWEVDLENNNHVFWSEVTKTIFGVDEDYQPALENCFNFFETESRQQFQDALYNAMDNGRPFDLELEVITPAGIKKWIRCIAEAEFQKNKCVKIVGSIQDITEKKASSIELEKRNQFIEATLNNLPIGIAVNTINDGIATLFNKKFIEIYGWPEEKLKSIDSFFKHVFPNPEYRNRIKNQVISDLSSGDPEKMQWSSIEITTQSGEKRIINAKNIPLFGQNLMISTVLDVTKEKKAENELIQLNEDLEKHARELAISNAELEQFAYVASHDLQEPLRMVNSFLTQLEKKYSDQLDDKAKQYIHYAVDGAKRMRQIILDLLNYSRVGKKTHMQKEINLNRLLDEITVLERSAIKETDASITWDKLPVIHGAETPIQQLFQNLINNALKYHKPGVPPAIHISYKEFAEKWHFTIKDNGIGIDEQYRENIFTIFQRLHTQDEYAGTGIGLAIAKKIVENHDGTIWVDSKEGKGSSFHFTIKK